MGMVYVPEAILEKLEPMSRGWVAPRRLEIIDSCIFYWHIKADLITTRAYFFFFVDTLHSTAHI